MAEILLIRHFATKGNREGRYIGVTDEPICQEDVWKSPWHGGFQPEQVFVSPLRRCVQTAKLLFPGVRQIAVVEFRECDFGEFENRNYRELSGNPAYQKWVDSQGTLPFPGGEEPGAFRARCRQGFLKSVETMRKSRAERCAMVVHGGTIMSILEAFGQPKRDFYDWQVKNGQGFLLEFTWDAWEEGRSMPVAEKR